MLFDRIPVETLIEFERTIDTALEINRNAVVLGNWDDTQTETETPLSSLNVFLEWLAKWGLEWVVKQRQANHARTLLLTREGASINIVSQCYTIEMLVTSVFAKMELKTVKLNRNDPRRCEDQVDSLQRLSSHPVT